MLGRTAPQTLRASLILTANYVKSTAVVVPAGVARVGLRITYTRGAALGYPSILLFVDDVNPPLQAVGILQGTATQTNELVATPLGEWEMQPFGTGGPAGAAAVTVTVAVVLPPGTYVAVSCKETGVAGTPGTLAVVMVGATE